MKNYKNYLFYGAVTLVVVGSVFLLSRTQNQIALKPSEALAATHADYDFGQVSMSRGLVNHKYTVTNNSANPVEIDMIHTSCMCTEASLVLSGNKFGPYGMPGHGSMPRVGQILSPGQSADIETVFDPAAHGPAGLGKLSRAVSIETTNKEALELRFNVEVVP